MGKRNPIEDLKRQHGLLAAELDGIRELARKLQENSPEDLCAEFRGRMGVLRQALDTHFLREEEALFPAARELVSGGGAQAGLLDRFLEGEQEDDLTAHSVMSARMEQAEHLLAMELDGPTLAKVKALVAATASLCEAHSAKEDTMIFPIIERSLTPEQHQHIWERMEHLRPPEAPPPTGEVMGLKRLGE